MLCNALSQKKSILTWWDSNQETALIHAAKKGNLEIGKLLAEAGADLNLSDKSGNTALKEAVKSGNVEMTELLLSYKTITPTFGQKFSQELLEHATINGQNNVIEALLMADKEFDVNFFISLADKKSHQHYKITPLRVAIDNHNVAAAKLLLEDNRIDLGVTGLDTLGSEQNGRLSALHAAAKK